MADRNELADRFESHRAHLHAVALRMLGNAGEAEDAVQEAWLRVARADADDIDNFAGWLTTIVARVCLNMLRARRARPEEPLDGHAQAIAGAVDDRFLADSVGMAMLVVLDRLSPAERVAFVLHDLFDLPFDDVATILDRSPEATRQLASRARRRVRGATAPSSPDHDRRRTVIAAFLAASREGDFSALLALLDPHVVLGADAAAIAMGAQPEVRGAEQVADTFTGRAQGARLARLDGVPDAIWAPGDRPRVAFRFTIEGDRIARIDLVADAERLGALDWQILEA